MTRSISLALVALPIFVLAVACAGESDNLPPPPPPPPPPPAAPIASTPPPGSTQEAVPEKPPAPPVALTAGAASPDPTAPLPTAKVTAPTKGQVVAADKANDFVVKLDVKNWQTSPGSSHVHLILDNKPYKAIYDPKAPVKLSELTGGEPLAEGQHVLVTFPSRANHESVKTKDALSVTEFYVGKKSAPAVDLKKPMLIYSRPKGDYNGDMANHVLIDFQLLNDVLGDDKDHVNVAVSGPGIEGNMSAKVTKFGTPYYLDNLQNGTYTVKLDLVDKSDKPVAGQWNSTTREIKINHEAQAEAPMQGHDMPAAAPASGGVKGDAPKAGSGGRQAAPGWTPPGQGAAPASSAAPKKP